MIEHHGEQSACLSAKESRIAITRASMRKGCNLMVECVGRVDDCAGETVDRVSLMDGKNA